MKLKADLHTHMNGNGQENRWNNIKFICENSIKLGYNAVYLGCHDYVGSNFKSIVEEVYNLFVITGAEITTTGGHLLAYNIKNIPKDCWANNKNPVDINLVIDRVHDIGGKIVMAHPYPINKHFTWPNKFIDIVNKLDGAEIANYKSFLRDGIVEFDWIKQYRNLQLFRGSDCHPWEGDSMHKDYYTEIESNWFV